jgi:hypothetical protein
VFDFGPWAGDISGVNRNHLWGLVLCAAVSMACPKKEEPIVDEAPVELSKALPPAPPPPVAAVTSTAPPSRAKLLEAYAASCDYQVRFHLYEDSGELAKTATPECSAREFEQNCAPDRYGCWDNLEKCKDACAAPCHQCEASCVSSCASCKTTCEKDADPKKCAHECANKRLGCRDGCVKALDTCRTVTCPKDETACNQAGEAKVAKECGKDCKAFSDCVIATVFEGDGKVEDCQAKFPKLSENCRNWCLPDS